MKTKSITINDSGAEETRNVIVCDMCEKIGEYGGANNHEYGSLNSRVLVRSRYAHDRVSASDFTRLSLDVCNDCADKKLIPWLKYNSTIGFED